LKAVYHSLVSSAEIRRAFNWGFDTVNLHRPTVGLCGENMSLEYWECKLGFAKL
jgi:hypothetical protein